MRFASVIISYFQQIHNAEKEEISFSANWVCAPVTHKCIIEEEKTEIVQEQKKVFDKFDEMPIIERKHCSAGGKKAHVPPHGGRGVFGKDGMVMRQFWGYQNSGFGMQASFEPSASFAYSHFPSSPMQIPLPVGFLISESP